MTKEFNMNVRIRVTTESGEAPNNEEIVNSLQERVNYLKQHPDEIQDSVWFELILDKEKSKGVSYPLRSSPLFMEPDDRLTVWDVDEGNIKFKLAGLPYINATGENLLINNVTIGPNLDITEKDLNNWLSTHHIIFIKQDQLDRLEEKVI